MRSFTRHTTPTFARSSTIAASGCAQRPLSRRSNTQDRVIRETVVMIEVILRHENHELHSGDRGEINFGGEDWCCKGCNNFLVAQHFSLVLPTLFFSCDRRVRRDISQGPGKLPMHCSALTYLRPWTCG